MAPAPRRHRHRPFPSAISTSARTRALAARLSTWSDSSLVFVDPAARCGLTVSGSRHHPCIPTPGGKADHVLTLTGHSHSVNRRTWRLIEPVALAALPTPPLSPRRAG